MKYKCLACGKLFVHPAKQTTYEITGDTKAEFVHPGDHMVKGQVEKSICPYCQSLDFDEVRLEDQKITSVKTVDLADADAFLKQGYEVHELYAKTATLIKKEEKKE